MSIKTVISKTDFVSVLLVVKKNKTNKVIRWKYGDNHKSVSGSLGHFHVKLKASEYDKKKDKIVPLKIKLDHMRDLNKIGSFYKNLWAELEKHNKTEKKLKVKKTKIKQKLS